MDLARVGAALADPVRISMLELIAAYPGESLSSPSHGVRVTAGCDTDSLCVCEFVRHLRISQPRASYHLKVLREAGLVLEEPRGKWTYYRINRDQVAAFCRRLLKTAGVQGTRGRN
jgi:ArsR family transcriptional regulator